MADSTSTASIRINSDGSGLVSAAKSGADALGQLDDRASKLAEKWKALGAAQASNTNATQSSTEGIGKLDKELEQLLGRIDPAYRATTELANAQGLLARSAEVGLLSQQQYTDALGKLPQAFNSAADGAGKSALGTAGARRELIVLGHEAMTGNFSRMPGSFMVLAERIGASGASLLGIAAPIAAVAAGAAIMFKVFSDGEKDLQAVNNALAITSNYAGMTRGSMDSLAQSVSRNSSLTIGVSNDIVTSLVASGRYTRENVEGLAGMVDNYARATGQSADKAAAQLVKMFEDPARASQALNEQYHYLSLTELERIRRLEETGDKQQAVTVAIDALSAHLPDHAKNIGTVEGAWDRAKKAVTGYLDAAGRTLAPSTSEDNLAQAKGNLTIMRNANAAPLDLAKAQAAVDLAQRQVDVERKLAEIRSGILQTQQREIEAQNEINKSATAQVAALTRLRDTIQADGVDSPDKARRIFEINKQIADLQRSMGAEGVTLATQREEATLRLRQITIAMAQDANDTALKTKQISQEEHDKTQTALLLQKNAVEQIAKTQELANGGLTAAARQALELTLQRLKAEAAQIQFKGDNQVSVDQAKALEDQRKLLDGMIGEINKVGDADLKRLNASIAAQRLHNQEIGKTKAQIDEIKQADEDATTAKLQGEADAIAALLQEQGLNQDAIDIYTALLDQLKAQIKARRELSGLMGDAAVRQREADAAAQYTKDWKRANDEISRALTDSLMRGFEGGKSFAQNFRDGLLNMFKTLILRPVISFLVQPISGAISAAMSGLGFSSNALAGSGSGFGNIASLASNASSLFSTGPITALSSIFAPEAGAGAFAMAGDSIAALGADSVGGLTASGLASGIGAALPWVGGAIAVASMLGLFDGGGPKPSEVWLQGGPGSYNVGINNAEGGNPDMSQVLALNAALNDPTKYDQSQLAQFVGRTLGNGSPADTASLLSTLTTALQPAAQAAQDSLAVQQQQLQTQQQLVSQQDQLNSSITSSVSGLSDKLGIGTLQAAVNGLATSDYNSPLDQFAAAKQQLNDSYAAAIGGDLTAVQNFPQVLQSALTIGRDVYASGPEFQDLFKSGNQMLQDLLNHQQDVQTNILKDLPVTIMQASANTNDVLVSGFNALKDQLSGVQQALRQLAAAA